jgi:hypothetical protein
MYLQIATRQGQKQTELLQGKGFLSFQKCNPGTEVPPLDSNGRSACDLAYNNCIKNANGDEQKKSCSQQSSACTNKTAGVAPGDCADSDKTTVTPGSVISDQLDKQLGLGSDKLAAADEINEIVSALLNQVISHVIGGIGSGLRGLSSPSGSGNAQSFASLLAGSTAASTTDYFGAQQNTQILNVPPPNLNYNLNPVQPPNPTYPASSTNQQPFTP